MRRCSKCCRALPAWDSHPLCQQHRSCSNSRPCEVCASWPAQRWAQEEAWRQENLSCIRSPVLAPVVPPAPLGADQSAGNAAPSASRKDASPASPGTALELHASEDSDWESGEEPPRQWRPSHADKETSQPSRGQRGSTRGALGEDTAPAELTPQPQSGPPVSASSGRLEPPVGLGNKEAGIPTGPQVLPGDNSPFARPMQPQMWYPQYQRPLSNTPAVPTSAVRWTGDLPDDVPLSTVGHGTKRPAPRQSPGGSPESSPKRKKKKGDKRGKGKSKSGGKSKTKAKPPAKHAGKKRGASEISDSDLYQLMASVAERHGWFAGMTAPGAAPRAAPLAAPSAPPMAPPPSHPVARPHPTLPQSRAPAALGAPPGETGMLAPGAAPQAAPLAASLMAPPPIPPVARPHPSLQQSRAPAALGAPPGEESFFPRAPATMQGPSSGTDDVSSEWSSGGRSHEDSDIWSVTSGAPSVLEQEPAPGLRHIGEEAEALLLRYLGEFYSVPAETPESQAQPSMLFRSGTEQDAGIPLTPDFKREYERIAKEPPPRGSAQFFSRAFLFREEDTTRFLASEKLSPELVALGEHMGMGNPLRRTSDGILWPSYVAPP